MHDIISSRGGITLFLRYIKGIRRYLVISKVLLTGNVIFRTKGLQLDDFLKQMFAFFIDGTNKTMTSFDRRKSDEGYSCLLGCPSDKLASQHQMKHFFSKLYRYRFLLNCIFHELIIWRPDTSQQKVIILGVDTMGVGQ